MGNYRELEVWNLAREIVRITYEVSALLPDTEKFGLVSQMRRAAVSIPCNIAEGAGRKTDGSFVQFLRIAIGSVNETETLLVLAIDLGFLKEESVQDINGKLRSLGIKLQNLAQSLRNEVIRESAAIYMSEAECGDVAKSRRLLEDHQATT